MNRKVENPTHGVLKKRITESNQVLVSITTGRIVIVGARVWTPKETFKIMGGAHGKVFVTPQKKKSFTREVAPELLDMHWVEGNSMTGGDFIQFARMVEVFKN